MSRGGTRAQAALERHYERLQGGFVLEDSGKYTSLVVPNGNACAPVHRWFHMKEAFSSTLLMQVLADTHMQEQSSVRVLDPFAGVGTTAISLASIARQHGMRHVSFSGFECNPFIQLVGAAKLKAIQEPSKTFGSLARKVANAAHHGRVQTPPIPDLSTFHNDRYFDSKDVKLLLRIRSAIDLEASAGAKLVDIELARLCLAATIEPISSLRRDGRALRYVCGKRRARPIHNFLARVKQIEKDMPEEGFPIQGQVHLGDGRSMSLVAPNPTFDLVIFSPPYPNNIDYTEVYKMEGWLLGMYDGSAAFQSQRLKTVHSHPSIKRESVDAELDGVFDVLAPILDAVPEGRHAIQRRAMIGGYARDMVLTLKSAWHRLRPGGSLVYVVGNSLHGDAENGFIIAADLIMGEIAIRQGFVIERIEVARRVGRRRSTSPFRRESIVFAKRPEN